jgi:hypothetical protein
MSHDALPLTLLVPRIFADDAQHTASFDDFAFIANLFNGCPDFHVSTAFIYL